ncbi:MAG: glucose-6-phosphate dehydrogenase assembly protein OpcA [Pyrinomonadaceae bacterium]
MIPIQGTINPEAVERELQQLWLQTSQANQRDLKPDDERATMRARVANLLIFVTDESAVDEVNKMLVDLSTRHPCRALLMVGAEQEPNRDIEMSVASFSKPSGKKTDPRLCCEQVTLNARGRFVVELPSAAIPLLVPDLPVFLWWNDELNAHQEVLTELADRADRVIIDSTRFVDAGANMLALVDLVSSEDENRAAISDVNWARLTSWRALIAGCFDSAAHRPALNEIASVRIEYAPNSADSDEIAPQARLIAGWLASRLNWGPATGPEITFERVEHPLVKPGRLMSVRLLTESEDPTTFEVRRSEDGIYLKATIGKGTEIRELRTSKVRNRSVADLVSREMEILCRDRVYEEAVLVRVAS